VTGGRVVRGLGEAQAGYEAALVELLSRLQQAEQRADYLEGAAGLLGDAEARAQQAEQERDDYIEASRKWHDAATKKAARLVVLEAALREIADKRADPASQWIDLGTSPFDWARMRARAALGTDGSE
jgi:hypothetical protein